MAIKANKDTLKKNKNRESIIKIARIVFTKYGYEKTRMEQIAKASGLGKSSVYYYFPSKERIFQAVVLKEAILFRRTIIESISKDDNPAMKIKIYILTRMNILKIYTNFHLALKNVKLRHIDFVRRLNIFYDNEEIRLFKNILLEGMNKKYFDVNDPETAAMAIIMAVKGIEDHLLRAENPEIFASRIDALIQIVLYGVANQDLREN